MSAKNDNRITFANILVAAGYDPLKVLDAIGFPVCNGVTVNADQKPDDDFRVRTADHILIDHGRNIGGYDSMAVNFNDILVDKWANSTMLLPIGSEFIVETYDGWGGLWKNTPFTVVFLYSTGETVSTVNGDSFQGVSSDSPGPYPWPGYYKDANGSFIPKLWDYYRNGTPQSIPPPKDWKLPDFLPLNS